MLSTHLSQKSDHHTTSHNGSHLVNYSEHTQQHQQSDIQALHEDSIHCTQKNLAVFIS
jgi:hypothetical protein